MSFLLLETAKFVAPLIIFENPCVYVAILIIFEGVTRREEQHIIQKTTAKKRQPVFEKLLEFDLERTSLKESILSSELQNELKF